MPSILERYAKNLEAMERIILLLFGIACLLLALWHEFRWFKRRNWLRVQGQVIEIVSAGADDDAHPKIEYSVDDITLNFVSDYGGSSCPAIGDSVVVLHEPSGRQAEHLTQTNRWLFTIVPFLFFMAFSYFAIFIH